MSPADPRIIVALDFSDRSSALALVEQLEPDKCRLKVGKEVFTRLGPGFVEALQNKGFEVFLDLKYHDIPNTVAAACVAAAELGVWMVNLHASGGRRMMLAARESLEPLPHRPWLIAVTILTSLEQEELAEVGFAGTPESNVLRLAALAEDAGLDGVVCSPREAASIRAQSGDQFRLVTPGVRPVGAALNDQKRVLTPQEAIRAGATYLVIGRPITAAANPTASLYAIDAAVTEALNAG
jgi:orotidine-5'-phosphate decarboxylase